MTWGLPITPTDAPAYEWDAWRAKDYVLVGVSNLPAECLEISTSARMALTTAIAELVRDHLIVFDSENNAQFMIEAAWAFIAPGYSVELALPSRPVARGPGPEPIRILVTILFDMVRGEGGPDRSLPLAWMDALARHIFEDIDAYSEWFDHVLDRLAKYHPEPQQDIFSQSFYEGPPVDRTLFDLTVEYEFDPSASALAAYLSQVAPANPFIEPIG